MKISEDTISILNNFSSINAALLFNEGSDCDLGWVLVRTCCEFRIDARDYSLDRTTSMKHTESHNSPRSTRNNVFSRRAYMRHTGEVGRGLGGVT